MTSWGLRLLGLARKMSSEEPWTRSKFQHWRGCGCAIYPPPLCGGKLSISVSLLIDSPAALTWTHPETSTGLLPVLFPKIVSFFSPKYHFKSRPFRLEDIWWKTWLENWFVTISSNNKFFGAKPLVAFDAMNWIQHKPTRHTQWTHPWGVVAAAPEDVVAAAPGDVVAVPGKHPNEHYKGGKKE